MPTQNENLPIRRSNDILTIRGVRRDMCVHRLPARLEGIEDIESSMRVRRAGREVR